MTTAWTLGALCALTVAGTWLALESDRGPLAGLCICLSSVFGIAAVVAAVI